MKFLRFEINNILYLSIIVVSLIAWMGFELFHRQNYVDINPVLISASQSPLPESFDEKILKAFYEIKNDFYEVQKGENPEQR